MPNPFKRYIAIGNHRFPSIYIYFIPTYIRIQYTYSFHPKMHTIVKALIMFGLSRFNVVCVCMCVYFYSPQWEWRILLHYCATRIYLAIVPFIRVFESFVRPWSLIFFFDPFTGQTPDIVVLSIGPHLHFPATWTYPRLRFQISFVSHMANFFPSRLTNFAKSEDKWREHIEFVIKSWYK